MPRRESDPNRAPVAAASQSTLRVRVKPGSRRGPRIEEGPDGMLVVTVREPATEGKANAAVERVLADYLGVAPTRVTIVRGQSANVKTVRVT